MTKILQFTGAQGVGKTTLVKRLITEVYPDAVFIGEVSRTLLNSGDVTGVDTSASIVDQLKIDAELILQYLKAVMSAPKMIVAERTAIDCLAYTNLLGKPGEIQYIKELAIRFIDIVEKSALDIETFYIPPVIPFVEDGVRNNFSQDNVDRQILEILTIRKIPFHVIGQMSVDARLQEVINVLGR